MSVSARRCAVFLASLLALCVPCVTGAGQQEPQIPQDQPCEWRQAQQDLARNGTPAPPLTPRQLAEARGDIHMARKQFTDAIAAYQKLLSEEPRNPVLLNKVGIAYHQLMNLSQAKRYYERAIKVRPDFASAVNNLGMVHYNRKKFRQAVENFQKALKINAAMPAVHSNLGHALFEQKKYPEAFQAFQRALALDPEVFDRRGSAAGTLLQDRSVQDRRQYFLFVAKTFASAGDAARCASYLRKAIDEGFQDLPSIEKDPAFAPVLKDPLVQEVLARIPPASPKSE